MNPLRKTSAHPTEIFLGLLGKYPHPSSQSYPKDIWKESLHEVREKFRKKAGRVLAIHPPSRPLLTFLLFIFLWGKTQVNYFGYFVSSQYNTMLFPSQFGINTPSGYYIPHLLLGIYYLFISLYLIKKKKRSKRIKKYIKEKYIKRKDITKYILCFIFYL